MKKSRMFVMLLAPALLLAAGCLTTNFVYPNDAAGLFKADAGKTLPDKVAVLPFEDVRQPGNTFSTAYLSLIPLYPYGYVSYHRPDAASGFLTVLNYNFKPAEELAKAAALSMRRSGLFQNVYFTYGGELAQANFVLQGRVTSTFYEGTAYSYGLSCAGSYLALVGAPYGSSLNRLGLSLTLKNRFGVTVWEYSAEREARILQWIYTDVGADLRQYPALMQQIMNDAMRDLAAKIKTSPQQFK